MQAPCGRLRPPFVQRGSPWSQRGCATGRFGWRGEVSRGAGRGQVRRGSRGLGRRHRQGAIRIAMRCKLPDSIRGGWDEGSGLLIAIRSCWPRRPVSMHETGIDVERSAERGWGARLRRLCVGRQVGLCASRSVGAGYAVRRAEARGVWTDFRQPLSLVELSRQSISM